MRRLLFSLLLLSVGCSRVPDEVSVVEQLESSTALITKPNGNTGTGFMVAGDYMVTCYHVAGPIGSRVVIDFKDGTHIKGIVVAQNKAFDLDVVRIFGRSRPNHLRIRDESPSKGESVTWLGNPMGFTFMVDRGVVSSLVWGDPRGGGVGTTIISGHFMPGYSGSAVVDKYGRVIGIADAVILSPRFGLVPIGFAVPSERIAWFLRANKIPYQN